MVGLWRNEVDTEAESDIEVALAKIEVVFDLRFLQWASCGPF
jgi:hypothetical protein